MQETEEKKEAKWYAVQAYQGKENLVCKNLISKVKIEEMEDKILNAIVPETEKIIIKGGKRIVKKETSYLLWR